MLKNMQNKHLPAASEPCRLNQIRHNFLGSLDTISWAPPFVALARGMSLGSQDSIRGFPWASDLAQVTVPVLVLTFAFRLPTPLGARHGEDQGIQN